MAIKSKIVANKRRLQLVDKFFEKRKNFKKILKSKKVPANYKKSYMNKLFKLPRNSSPTRIYRRCLMSGRNRGVYRDFGLSRHVIRELALEGLLPGVIKASW